MKFHALNMILGIILGGLVYLTYWVFPTRVLAENPLLLFMGAGAIIGLVVGGVWPMVSAFVLSHRFVDWRLQEVEIQGMKFTSAGAQRHIAWMLFVEIATRVSTQPMTDEEGDNGAALRSLYNLFQLTRKALSEMQPTPRASGDTVESYALDMLNTDLRPFLSKWHPAWENFARGGQADARKWSDHQKFRGELRLLHVAIEKRARGLARIVGVKNADRCFPRTPEAH